MTEQVQEDKRLIEVLKNKIVEHLKAPAPDKWQQRDFENLSIQIEEKTKVILSVSTLKRIWKNEYQKLPHKNTLNALVEYVGYKNWYDFACSNSAQSSTSIKKVKLKFPKILPIVVTATAIAAVLFLVFIFYSGPAKSYSEATFSSRKAVSEGVPNTVVFDYDVSMYEFDSAFIQQSWDMRRRARIEKNENQATSVYYYPGYHHAKLIINDQIVKEDQVYITTDKWISMVNNKKNELVPVYINENCISDGIIHTTTEQLVWNNIDLETNDYRVSYHYANESLWCNTDSFAFETALKNGMDEGGITCQKCQILFLGTHGMHMLSLSDNGCIGTINQNFGDNFINGQKNDLSAFGTNLNEWQTVKLKIQNKVVEVNVGDNKAYKTSYERSIGKLIGITFAFSGCGSVNYLTLKNSKDEVFFTESFD